MKTFCALVVCSPRMYPHAHSLVGSLRTKVTFGLQGLSPNGFWKNEGMNDIGEV